MSSFKLFFSSVIPVKLVPDYDRGTGIQCRDQKICD